MSSTTTKCPGCGCTLKIEAVGTKTTAKKTVKKPAAKKAAKKKGK